MTDFFREVDEEVRRDQALEAFKRYQPYIFAVALAIIAATAGYRYYEYSQTQAAQTAGLKYQNALALARGGNSADAQAGLEDVAKSGPDGYRAIALLRDAGLIGARDRAAGLAAFESLAANPALTRDLQDLARLRAAMLRIDVADKAEMLARLQPMAAEGQTYRHTAREYLALAALRANDMALAGQWLDTILADPSTPDNLRRRAEEFSGLVRAGMPAPGAK